MSIQNRIKEVLRRSESKKLLIPFFTAGFPTPKQTINLVKVAVDCGVDMVELGMPFSDPLADGPEIQYSSQVALRHGMNLSGVLAMTEAIRRVCDLPVLLMGYSNPILAMGVERFLVRARAAGADGLIIPDLPVSEARSFRKSVSANELSMVFLAAPTTPESRLKRIDAASTDFVYAVTVTGVTGTGKKFGSKTASYLKHLKHSLKKPFVAGFGVSDARTAEAMTRYADGVVIGSALVRICRNATRYNSARRSIQNLLTGIRRAI